MTTASDLFVTSIWGNSSVLEQVFNSISSATRVHFLGNYFDSGPDPVGVFNRLVNITMGRTNNVVLYRYFHEDALLRLTGHIEDTEDYRRFWISPYLGTPFTLSQFGIDPWPAYHSRGTRAQPVHAPITTFLQDKTSDWSALPITSEQKLLLKAEMRLNHETRLLKFASDSPQIISTTPCDHHFFERTLCPWVEDQLNPFPTT
jgi:hypothetical protein